MTFVTAYSKATGRKQRVPEHWLGHPVLGRNLRKTPLSDRQRDEAAPAATNDTPAAGEKE